MPILTQLEALLPRFAGLRIGVIGDFALDGYWLVEPAAALPSVETGKPTQPVTEQRYAPGAAGNVVANLLALGCQRVQAFGVVGRDPWGAELRLLLEKAGADTAELIVQAQDWATVAYMKPHVGGIEQSRVDFGDFNRLQDATADRVVGALAQALPGLDALVINSQAQAGLHSPRFRRHLADLLASRREAVRVVDSRDPEAMYPGCLLKINDREAVRHCGIAAPASGEIPRDLALAATQQLYAARGRPVFVTRGRAGIAVCDRAGIAEIPAIELGHEVDTTGAGDAALAGIVAALACGTDPVLAARVGTLAAAVCAGKLRQTGTASPAEILALAAKLPGPARG